MSRSGRARSSRRSRYERKPMADETDTAPQEESLFEAPPMAEQERMVEAILFASAEPVTVTELAARMPHASDPAEALVHLRKRYEGRGVQVARIGDGYAMRTAPDLGFLMQKDTVEIRKLSRAAIETLAIIGRHTSFLSFRLPA